MNEEFYEFTNFVSDIVTLQMIGQKGVLKAILDQIEKKAKEAEYYKERCEELEDRVKDLEHRLEQQSTETVSSEDSLQNQQELARKH
ncbi:hypothetical protein P9112_007197 [Eukaryota sp. TZLM1-RC]